MTVQTDAGARRTKAKLTLGQEAAPVAKTLVGHRGRYVAVAKRASVPCRHRGIHRESHRAISLASCTTGPENHPDRPQDNTGAEGQGASVSWKKATMDALVNCHPYTGRNTVKRQSLMTANWDASHCYSRLDLYGPKWALIMSDRKTTGRQVTR